MPWLCVASWDGHCPGLLRPVTPPAKDPAHHGRVGPRSEWGPEAPSPFLLCPGHPPFCQCASDRNSRRLGFWGAC